MASPTPTLDPELKTYSGNCHCGAFKFSIKIPEITCVTECSCSICFKKAYMWVYPGAENVIIEKGEGSLINYEFGQHEIVHKFCPTCGTGIMEQQKQGGGIGINARTLQNLDIWSLKVDKSDGAVLKPIYQSPLFTGSEPAVEFENSKLYTGSCHCGTVTMALKNRGPVVQDSVPTAISEAVDVIGECNCSICARLGRILTYRPPVQISIHLAQGTGLSSYSFGTKRWEHKFCSVCGVAVGSDDVVKNTRAVNLRCFEGVEWSRVETHKHNGRLEG